MFHHTSEKSSSFSFLFSSDAARKQTNLKSVHQLLDSLRQHLKPHKTEARLYHRVKHTHTIILRLEDNRHRIHSASFFFFMFNSAVYVAAGVQVLPGLCEKNGTVTTLLHDNPPLASRTAIITQTRARHEWSIRLYGINELLRACSKVGGNFIVHLFCRLPSASSRWPTLTPPPPPRPATDWPPFSLTALQQKWKEMLLLPSQYSSASLTNRFLKACNKL